MVGAIDAGDRWASVVASTSSKPRCNSVDYLDSRKSLVKELVVRRLPINWRLLNWSARHDIHKPTI